MNYDQTTMPEVYDRARALSDATTGRWMAAVSEHAPPTVSAVLDLGCGTGRFTAPLAETFASAVVHGVEPSSKML